MPRNSSAGSRETPGDNRWYHRFLSLCRAVAGSNLQSFQHTEQVFVGCWHACRDCLCAPTCPSPRRCARRWLRTVRTGGASVPQRNATLARARCFPSKVCEFGSDNPAHLGPILRGGMQQRAELGVVRHGAVEGRGGGGAARGHRPAHSASAVVKVPAGNACTDELECRPSTRSSLRRKSVCARAIGPCWTMRPRTRFRLRPLPSATVL